jgi:alkylation response protein AidB-like acyl-CoA dehydrogenase
MAARRQDVSGQPTAGRSAMSRRDVTENEVLVDFARACASGEFDLPLPGGGRTLARFQALRRFGHGELALARLGEGHADARAILHEAGTTAPASARLGVWAAGPLGSLQARADRRGWRLVGVRRWCSGALSVSHALVTAATPDGPQLFLVPTASPGVIVDSSSWPAVGMAASGTYDVAFDDVSLEMTATIGCPGFYLSRPGFWVGAAGVAAVWLGGAEAVAAAIPARCADNPHALAHLGAVHARLVGLSGLLEETARRIDRALSSAGTESAAVEILARTLRAEVESGATEILERTGRATGAGPLGHDGGHARRVADLTVYLRQSHAESDLAALGALVVQRGGEEGE